MTDNTAPERVYLRVCRNPHEPFFWDADTPDEGCPGEGCEDDPHETYIKCDALIRWLDEQGKATMDEHRNFRSGYDEGRFDAFGAVEAYIEGRDTNE